MSVSVCLSVRALHQVTWPSLVPPLAALGTGIRYVIPVMLTTSYGGMSTNVAETPLQSRAQANTPAAWC